jgi:ubiquinone/menaquinone biosynthesis C-methylase UbiE
MSPHPAPPNDTTPPNHHAHYPGFSGASGLLAASSMLVGRGDVARLACELVRITAGDTLVDLGCGPGAAAREAARRGATVIGVDPAPVMLRVARMVPSRGRVSWVVGSAERTGLETACATAVWSLSAVHHWGDLDAGLDDVARLLTPGGRFLAVEHLVQPGATGLAGHGWTADQADTFASDLTARGFVDIAIARHRHGRRSSISVRAVTAGPAATG